MLVEQSDLTVAVAGSEPGKPATPNQELPPQVPEVEGKVTITLYGKKAEEEKATKEKGASVASPGTKQ